MARLQSLGRRGRAGVKRLGPVLWIQSGTEAKPA